MKNIVFLLMTIMLGSYSPLKAQTEKSKYDTIKIKTSAICDECKERIETVLAFEKGVKSSNLDTATKVVTVIYKKDKTDIDKIRKAISEAGYDADKVKADPNAYRKLPMCCKKK